ncbi:leucine-rich repeat protein [Treponema sp.]|uniref:leucine-rich repeat protein n=1 Tax=Treponema sp. TaxID=166 RepID=UPI003FA26BB7
MKIYFNRKAFAFLGATAFMLAAVFTVSCKPAVSSNTPAETFAVTFVADEYGELKAEVDGKPIATNAKVEKGSTVTFTATPKNGYTVKNWTIEGGTFAAGTGTEENLTAKVKITANTNVGANFKIQKFSITFSPADADGTLTAAVNGKEISSGDKFVKDTEITFTATPKNTVYKVDRWTIEGGTFVTGTGTEGSLTAKVKITANTKVSVSFSLYEKVALNALHTYLQAASPTDIHYIEVTGLTAADLNGNESTPSRLGKILKDNSGKKVALKLSAVSGVTNMQYCFNGCTNLTQVSKIPAGVTDMSGCFFGCTNLTQVSKIPAGVTNMQHCFNGCTSLTEAPEIPAGVTEMSGCFSYCTSLTKAPEIPTGVTNMSGCFFGCTSLTEVPKIPTGVTDMIDCFNGCTNLTKAPEIPTGVKDMSGCFSDCTNLTKAPEIPIGVKDMRGCFSGCTNLTKAPKIPTGVTDMSYCFCDCTSLTKAPVIPIGVTQMTRCFCDCTSLTSAALQCTYNAGFMDAFSGCTSLAADSIKVPSDQLAAYKAGARNMGAQENWFTDR